MVFTVTPGQQLLVVEGMLSWCPVPLPLLPQLPVTVAQIATLIVRISIKDVYVKREEYDVMERQGKQNGRLYCLESARGKTCRLSSPVLILEL